MRPYTSRSPAHGFSTDPLSIDERVRFERRKGT